MAWNKKFLKNFVALFIGCVIALVILEVFLRLYNPFGFRIKSNKIVLPVNTELKYNNTTIKKLDSFIYTRRNSIGLRGEDPPKNFDEYLTLITIGGSTTECYFLSEGKTWTDVLGMKLKGDFNRLWINNAGIDASSTFGHIRMLEDYIARLNPKVVLFLVGMNDVARDDLAINEKEIIIEFRSGLRFSSPRAFVRSVSDYSEVFLVLVNLFRYFKAKYVFHLIDEVVDIEKLKYVVIPEEVIFKLKQTHKERYLKPYEERLRKLISISREHGIEPVLLTQPAVYGKGEDDVTQADLGRIEMANIKLKPSTVNGRVRWEILELYNDVTWEVGKKEGLLVVDLAREMPKSTKYYYDGSHYTNEGAVKVANIIYRTLCPKLAEKYEGHLRAGKNCKGRI